MILVIYVLILYICHTYQHVIMSISLDKLIFTSLCWCLVNVIIYDILDTLYPKYLSKYFTKQTNKNEVLTTYDIVPTTSINASIVHMLIWFLYKNINRAYVSPPRLIGEILFFVICYDISFFFLHKLIHMPSLYWIHKMHHKTYGTIAASCFYMTIYDMILEIFVPFFIGPWILRDHSYLSFIIWAVLSIFNTFKEHSGYGRDHHYIHHITSTKHFGLIFTDYVSKILVPNAP